MNASLHLASAADWPSSGNWPFLIGLVATVVFLAATSVQRPVAARPGKPSKPWAVLYGADGRRSTSKLTAYSWTAALLYGGVSLCAAALMNELPLADVGLDTLPEQYLVLLAVPYGSLVAAKLITQTKVEKQTLVKAPPAQGDDLATQRLTGPYEEGGFTAGDRGQRSLQDIQYLTFNALLLGYFIAALWATRTLPELPDWLVGLTGASAATFIAGKAVESEQPEITAVTQYQAGGTWVLQIRGKHLHQPVCGKTGGTLAEGAQFMELRECVTVDGQHIDDVVFLGEHGIDVHLKEQRETGTMLTVTLLGGVILTNSQ